jgi:hypothetical protein
MLGSDQANPLAHFRSIGGQLATIGGKHLFTDQAYFIANQQDLLEELGNLLS